MQIYILELQEPMTSLKNMDSARVLYETYLNNQQQTDTSLPNDGRD